MNFRYHKKEYACKNATWYVCFGIGNRRLLFINTWKDKNFENKVEFENYQRVKKWNPRESLGFNILLNENKETR